MSADRIPIIEIRPGIPDKKYLKMRSAPIPCGTGAIMKKFIFICN